MSEIRCLTPPNGGWLEIRLDSNEIDYVWERVKEKEISYESNKPSLAGDIHESKLLEDPDDWFFNNVLSNCCAAYSDIYRNMGDSIPIPFGNYSYYMREWWVNYQKQTEFNPMHDHGGSYSFVVWMKIPTSNKEQRELPIAKESLNGDSISNFTFAYTDVIGNIRSLAIPMERDFSGNMVVFPSRMKHQVYPFYECDEDRISIAGNFGVIYE